MFACFQGALLIYLSLELLAHRLQNLGNERKVKVFVLRCERISAGNSTEKRDRVQPCSEAPELKITWDMERKSQAFWEVRDSRVHAAGKNLHGSISISSLE